MSSKSINSNTQNTYSIRIKEVYITIDKTLKTYYDLIIDGRLLVGDLSFRDSRDKKNKNVKRS